MDGRFPGHYSHGQIASYLGVTGAALGYHRKAGNIPFTRKGHDYWTRAEDINKFFEKMGYDVQPLPLVPRWVGAALELLETLEQREEFSAEGEALITSLRNTLELMGAEAQEDPQQTLFSTTEAKESAA